MLLDIINTLQDKGPVFGLLVVAILYFYQRVAKYEADMKALRDKHDADMIANNDKLESYMKDDREKLLTAINNNTAVMIDIQKYLDGRK